ncbi:MAG: DHH family phosphoesterase [Bilifractor sp.]|jgi:c-di-AMP phosphodiesterase-like protein
MSDLKTSPQFRRYLSVPLWLILILVAADVGVCFVSKKAGAIMTVALVLYFLIELFVYFARRGAILSEMIAFAAQYGEIQSEMMENFSLPYAIADDQGKIRWVNRAFTEVTGVEQGMMTRSITGVFSDVTKDLFPDDDETQEIELVYNHRYYRAEMKRINTDGLFRNSGFFSGEEPESVCLYSFFMHDETELHEYMQKNRDDSMVAGLIYIDNYEEALDSVEEVRRSLLTALIERKITKYFHDIDGVVKKFEKDKFILVMRYSSLDELKAQHFSILESVKSVNIGNDMEVTISLGIGVNNGSLNDNFEAARIAMDLALGRGGDQAVIKEGETNTFFGGKTEAVEKNTRVKARVKAHALREFIMTKDEVVVMGHQLIDADAFGAAIGIYRVARTLNKKAHIVIDKVTSSMRPMIDLFKESPDFEDSMFLTTRQAEDITSKETLVIVVDTSRPSYTECPSLLKKAETIVVLDHHRPGQEVIKNAVLSYIEPYASSSCEMVSEILQYFSENVRIRNIEADALYAGIMVDTDNFMQKTGVRTFEAAAYLRRNGADVTRVRKLFREDMNDYRARGETISSAFRYRDNFVIAICPADYVESPTIVASQSANELLNIIGVRASFVLTEYDNRIYISARAIDEVNVSIIMERMGGGGHLNMAGCQLDNMTMEEAVDQLKSTIDQMIDEGEL